ncbi:hypothetical protein OG455_28005 [Kitasatospora sp. NBC_01287]|uniref:hypothetical protein n=1 Tax=Kitasatospora sp. NBC_01287 TaxID=2903573 RepID=UPI0022523483|nr:hypothetical protein [Kitasatospora sp. NBC_01287]MCX4749306.1 hypothetical protein [Kitasatospora sp. NBC_01287]
MTEKLTESCRSVLEPLLHPGERLLDVVAAYPVAGTSGVGIGPGTELGNAISRAGSITGGAGSIAAGFPVRIREVRKLLVVTDQRVLYAGAGAGAGAGADTPGRVAWQAPRALVTRVERRPRLQLLARFRLHFADGSAVSVMTPRREGIEVLAAALATPVAALPPQDARPQDTAAGEWSWPPEDARPFL